MNIYTLHTNTRIRKLLSDQFTSTTTSLNDGKSTRDIARRKISSNITFEMYRKLIRNEVQDLKSGRPQKLKSRDKRAIACLSVFGCAKTAA